MLSIHGIVAGLEPAQPGDESDPLTRWRAGNFNSSSVAISRHPSTTALDFVERFKSLPSGSTARSTQDRNGWNGRSRDTSTALGHSTTARNATRELTAAGISLTRTQTHHRGPVNPIVNRCARLLATR